MERATAELAPVGTTRGNEMALDRLKQLRGEAAKVLAAEGRPMATSRRMLPKLRPAVLNPV